MLDLCSCTGLFLAVANGGYSLLAVQRLLIAVASLVEERRLQSSGSVAVARGLQLPRGVWDLRGPGIIPMSPVGRFVCTVPLGKSQKEFGFQIATNL